MEVEVQGNCMSDNKENQNFDQEKSVMKNNKDDCETVISFNNHEFRQSLHNQS